MIIGQHWKKHINNEETNAKNYRSKVRYFLLSKNEVTKAECFKTLIEHNLPLRCIGHIGSLL